MLRGDRTYEQHVLKSIFIERSLESTCISIHPFWDPKRKMTVQELVHYATESPKVSADLPNTKTPVPRPRTKRYGQFGNNERIRRNVIIIESTYRDQIELFSKNTSITRSSSTTPRIKHQKQQLTWVSHPKPSPSTSMGDSLYRVIWLAYNHPRSQHAAITLHSRTTMIRFNAVDLLLILRRLHDIS